MIGINRIKPYVPILISMILWGSMGIPSTYALKSCQPLELLCFRSAIGALVLAPIVFKSCGSLRPAKSDWMLLFLLSVVGVVLCNYLYFFSLNNTALTNTAILYSAGPLMTAVLAAVFLKEAIKQSRAVGIMVAFIGVAELLTKGNPMQIAEISFNAGDLAELGSAFCLASYTILSKKISDTKPICVVFWLMLISFLTTLPTVLIGGLTLSVNDPSVFGSVIYLGVFCSGLGYLFQQISIMRIGAASSAAFLNGISAITVLSAALVLHEAISFVQIFSMVLIFVGLYLNAVNRNFFQRNRNCKIHNETDRK